jgi:multidrug efflux pump subunit AcrA (membrane-fusion protein)
MKLYTWLIMLALLSMFALSMSGCNTLGGATPQALPTVVLGDNSTTPGTGSTASPQASGSGVTASGSMVPAKQADMVFASGGMVKSVDVAAGDKVSAGQILVTLAGAEKLAAAVEAANFELAAAQQELLTAQDAQDQLIRDLPERQTQALQALTDAKEALRKADIKFNNINSPASVADLNEARANYAVAKDKLEKAQDDFEPYEKRSENNLQRAYYLSRLADAQRKFDAAEKNLNKLLGGTSEFFESQSEAELKIAQDRLDQAQKDYDTLMAGPDPEEMALAENRIKTAEARIKNAQAQLTANQAALSDLEMKAPFDGTVGRVDIHGGEWVTPGQVILVLADLDHLRVETTDLSERDIPKVKIGQPVTVFIEALGQDVAGKVSEISPLADTLGGDVVYRTTIDLDALPPGLRSGMSVEVQFENEP